MRTHLLGGERAWHRTASYAVGSVLFFTIITFSLQAQVSPKHLSKEDLIQLLEGDVAPKRVAQLARERGIDLDLTPQTESDIRRASRGNAKTVTDELMATLRKMASESAGSHLESSIGDLGVQSGLIAHTREELKILKRKGDRNYYDFTLLKGAKPQQVSTVSLQLKETNPELGRFTINVTSDDRTIEKKNRSVGEPIQFYTGRDHLLYEMVVWSLDRVTIAGYLSTPKNAPVPVTAD